ncbi:unnamed protein product [Merluccius merluccius]
MASTCHGSFILVVCVVVLSQMSAFPTPADPADDKTVYNRQLTEEKPLQEQIAEADSVKESIQSAETNPATSPKDSDQDGDDFAMLKSLADGQKSTNEMKAAKASQGTEQYVPDDSDSTKSRRLAEDYDSTKNGMDYGKYQDDPESFRQVDGTPLTAEDIVQKIANKIYEEHDRGVFDRIVAKLLKLGLITDSQAETLEYQVAEALQDLISENAKNNEIEDLEGDYTAARGEQKDQSQGTNDKDNKDDEDDEDEREQSNEEEEEEGGNAAGESWDQEEERAEEERAEEEPAEEGREKGGNEVRPEDGLQDLQYFPNFYRLLKSLDTDQDAQERETLITIMKTLIDFVKMMVKYGTITPEEGVSYLENLDAMIAMQTKNKLGKALGTPDFTALTGKLSDDDDNTKLEAAKMQKEYENLKDSTKGEQPPTEISRPGKSETYLEAIRKNIEWLKKHNKEEGKDDYDLSKLKDFMDQQVESYIEKGIIAKDEGETIKRIYSSL